VDEEAPSQALGIAAAFLARYLEDRVQGRATPLAAYQALFPGYEEIVAREYERLEVLDVETPLSVAPGDGGTPLRDGAGELAELGEIGPYRLLEVLGQGGMGVVYAAEQRAPIHRRVALKLVKRGMDSHEVLARFDSERQALALMNHPHIARVFDAGATADGRPYFVMELVVGVPITLFADEERLGTRERLEVFLQVCEAVQHAHQKGIIHRDLKPTNVLVAREDGERAAKIIDFGVAKSLREPLTDWTLFTHEGQLVGTPAYMSPEQFGAGAPDIDTRSDIYSLGLLLYELLAGTLPFDLDRVRRGGLRELQRVVCEEDAPPLSTRFGRLGAQADELAEKRRCDRRSLRRQLRGDLDWITRKATEKDRARRYASASELAADIGRHLRHEPVSAGPPGVAYRLRKFGRKHRVALAAAFAAFFLLVALTLLSRHLTALSHYRDAESHVERHRLLNGELADLDARWREAKAAHPSWAPVWERLDEFAAWDRLEDARERSGFALDRALLSFNQAVQSALPWTATRQRSRESLERLYFEGYKDALGRGELGRGPQFYKVMIESIGLGSFEKELERGMIAFRSDPPGAEIWCFRYEKHEGGEPHVVPLPFDPSAGRSEPARGVAGRPSLVVERVWEPALSPLVPGDRLLSLRGQELRSRSALAKVLASVSRGEGIEVRVLRAGSEETLRWIPFPARPADLSGSPPALRRLVSIRQQLGFTLEGYPLEFHTRCRVGVTHAEAPVAVELPRGSYLFVLRKPGYADARFPVAVPSEEDRSAAGVEDVRLLKDDEIPPGCVYIPACPVACGGDREVDQDLPRATHRLDGFFLSRLEVTVREYLEFVNSPEVLPETLDESGDSRGKDVRLIPHGSSGLLFDFDGAAQNWKPGPGLLPLGLEAPVFRVSVSAARRYAEWLTAKHGGRWRFRLPSDLEWEKAARGVDRRFYVWGNYPVWSFCRSLFGSEGRKSRAGPVGAYPLDESVFGVRDLAGSVAEPTSGHTTEGYVSLRGGSWYEPTEYYYRIANRLGRKERTPQGVESALGVDQGIRLAADLPAR
jgi:serine/threonine protein kinase/formylglycine-generating enzyme required for sulfatase activity